MAMPRRVICLGLLAPLLPAHAAGVIVLRGQGSQIYECTQAVAGYAWTLHAPDATLTDLAGHPAGRHFAGPSWQAADGSMVTAEKLASGAAPRPGAIPWLLLTAKSHGGQGMFTTTAYIVRSDTQGGVAPPSGCNAAHLHGQVRVPYSATYTFFPG